MMEKQGIIPQKLSQLFFISFGPLFILFYPSIGNFCPQIIYINITFYCLKLKAASKNNDTMKKFKILKELGTGSFGKVQLALHIESQENVAIKTISKQKLKTKEDIRMINKEIAVFKALQHQNIVRLYEILEDECNLYMVMEYMEKGDLLNYIKQHGTISQEKIVVFMKQLTEAVRYLHLQKNVAHRDIKLANILLDSIGGVKLGDFGLSNFYDKIEGTLQTSCGSPCYSAPEILKGKKYDPLPADVWSLGVVLYAMIQGNLPFYHENVKQMYRLVVKGRYIPMQKASQEMKYIIKRIFDVNPQMRMSILQFIQFLDALQMNFSSPEKFNSLLIPKLSIQSHQYVENIKAQTMTKILKYNGYTEQQIQNALSHRKNNKRALKFNHLNTFIELLQRKTFNKLKAMISKYSGEQIDESELEILDFNKKLQRTHSNFTRDTLKSSTRQERKQPKIKFVRNGFANKLEGPKRPLQEYVSKEKPLKIENILFEQKIIRRTVNVSYDEFITPLRSTSLGSKNITQNKYTPIISNLSSGYIKLKSNDNTLAPNTLKRNQSIDSIKFTKNLANSFAHELKPNRKKLNYSVVGEKYERMTLNTDRSGCVQENDNNQYREVQIIQ